MRVNTNITIEQAIADAAEWMLTMGTDDEWSDDIDNWAIQIADKFNLDADNMAKMIEEKILVS